MAELKQGRWVKVHEPGQANFVENENVMDIVIGTGRCQAEATYTVRSYKKAAFWLAEYLKAAEALQIVADEIVTQIQAVASNANREDDEVNTSGDGWTCGIEKMGDGSFKVQLGWTVDEPVTKKGKQELPEPKKRGRKKKEAI
ncbi:MAG: hypothetical protein RR365_08905 [Bacteroides sp.]